MKIKKILSDTLASCYAVTRLTHDQSDYLIVASEVEGACFAYDITNNFQKQTIWEDVGGTMSVVQIPGTLDFLATQRFYPGFNSKACRIVHGKYEHGRWLVEPLLDFPYLHRFDLIASKDGSIHFIGCTIANSKAFVEDWSDKGKVFVGRFHRENPQLTDLRALPLRLLKNHGYYRLENQGYSMITAVEGVFRLTYPDFSDTGDWRLDLEFPEETSDIVQIDFDNDGKQSYAVIQGFHGDSFKIMDSTFEKALYEHPEPTEFGHAIWSGSLLGEPSLVFGWRSGKADLLVFRKKTGQFETIVVEEGASSSNVLAFEKDGKSYIFSANNGKHEVALYELST